MTASRNILDELFPAAPPAVRVPRRRAVVSGVGVDATIRHKRGRVRREEISTRWAAIYALELRGHSNGEIAAALGVSEQCVYMAKSDDRYIAYREKHLTALDNDFAAMKPLAFTALRGGLLSTDENTALRAAEQWFKGANYGGFARNPEPAQHTTAEDVAAALLAQVNIAVNVTVDK